MGPGPFSRAIQSVPQLRHVGEPAGGVRRGAKLGHHLVIVCVGTAPAAGAPW